MTNFYYIRSSITQYTIYISNYEYLSERRNDNNNNDNQISKDSYY